MNFHQGGFTWKVIGISQYPVKGTISSRAITTPGGSD
jgi:hypothetical protein